MMICQGRPNLPDTPSGTALWPEKGPRGTEHLSCPIRRKSLPFLYLPDRDGANHAVPFGEFGQTLIDGVTQFENFSVRRIAVGAALALIRTRCSRDAGDPP